MLQKDRIQEANKLLSQVWSEMEQGYIDDDCLQDAVYCQVDINRIVWRLNSLKDKDDDDSCEFCKYQNKRADEEPCNKCKHSHEDRFVWEDKKT